MFGNSNRVLGICRDSRHKRRLTGGKVVINIKKRKFEMGRQPAMTKLGAKRIYLVRCRGGNIKHRAIASNNELVRTNTIVKGCIVSIDATPFKAWFEKHYSCKIGAKGEVTKDDLSKLEGVSKSNRRVRVSAVVLTDTFWRTRSWRSTTRRSTRRRSKAKCPIVRSNTSENDVFVC